jgi:hypothetical protein
MCAWFKSRGRKPPEPPKPRPFSGIGVYLTSEVHSARSSRGRLSPVALVDALAGILEYQSAIIEAHGGFIEQFVGDCVVAYWEPGDPAPTANSAYAAAKKILRGKVDIAGLEFRLRVNFSLADMAGAFFGPASGPVSSDREGAGPRQWTAAFLPGRGLHFHRRRDDGPPAGCCPSRTHALWSEGLFAADWVMPG